MPEHIPERVVAALREQTRRRTPGPRPIGWKIGRGIEPGQEHLEPVIGYLRPAAPPFDGSGAENLRVDAEVAIEVGTERIGAALELVDVTRPPDDFETIVAENIWHRGVVFGPLSAGPAPATFQARVLIDGEVLDATEGSVDVGRTVAVAERLLSVVGEWLQPSDRIIAGSILQVPVAAGDEVTVDLGALGQASVTIS